jgi:hypothetical protein
MYCFLIDAPWDPHAYAYIECTNCLSCQSQIQSHFIQNFVDSGPSDDEIIVVAFPGRTKKKTRI